MPNDHDQYEELIPDYVSGRLSQSERESLRLHAETCERCSKTMTELRPVFSRLDTTRSLDTPPGYFSTVVPNLRARIDAARSVRSLKPMAEFALPAAGLALVVIVLLTVGIPWKESTSGPEAISQAIGDVPADVLADALADQADRAGISDGSLLDVISDERFDREIVKALIDDPSALNDLESSSETLWPTDLSETELTTLLQRLSEREVL